MFDLEKGFFFLFAGMVIVQLIVFFSYPLVSRLYTASEFGFYKLFNSVVAILFATMPGRFDLAAIVTKKRDRAFALINLSVGLLVGYSFFLFFLFLFFDASIFRLFNIDIPLEYLLLIPFAVAAFGLLEITFNLWNREKRYDKIAIVKVAHRLFVVGCWIVWTYFEFPRNGLVAGLLLGYIITTGFIYFNSIRRISVKLKFKYSKKLGKHYKDFFIYSSPNYLLSVIADQLPLIMIAMVFDQTLLGFFALAYSLLSIPQQLIGGSIGPITFQKLSALAQERKSGHGLMVRTWLILLLAGILPCVTIILYGPELFGFFLGDSWIETGDIASILVPLTLIMVMNSGTISSNLVYKKQKLDLGFNVVRLVTHSLPFIIGAAFDSFHLALYLFVILGVFHLLGLNYFLLRSSKTE